jgi:hypothetical protein
LRETQNKEKGQTTPRLWVKLEKSARNDNKTLKA